MAFAFGVLVTAEPSSAASPSACLVLRSSPAIQQSGPAFLASFPTVSDGPLHGVAFLYDNAVAAIALVGCGEVSKAAQIADAMLAGLDHDRYWTDGRLRNGYLAGPVKHPLMLAGWWDTPQNKWVEDRYQVGSDTGNMAWAMLALLTLYEETKVLDYRKGAERIARFVETSSSAVRPGGFSGGTFGHEPKPEDNSWKSTEHNTDLAAAFSRLARDSGDAHWSKRAREAQSFVTAMWQLECHCFAVGTGLDGHSRNDMLALDAQLWPILALPDANQRYPGAFATAQQRLRQGDGYAYSEVRDGIWTEGTAQVALLLSLTGENGERAVLAGVLERNRTAEGAYYATSAGRLPTGFPLQTDPTQPRLYFHLPHLAALSWVALYEQRFNPFTGAASLPDTPRQ